MKNFSIVALIAVAGLAGCVSDSTGTNQIAFEAPSPADRSGTNTITSMFVDLPPESILPRRGIPLPEQIDVPDFGIEDPLTFSRSYVGGVGRFTQAGIDQNGRYLAMAGVVNASAIDDRVPMRGTAKYEGNYTLLTIDRNSSSDNRAVPEANGGTIVLRADFANGTFRGRTPDLGDDTFQLTFSGDISRRSLTGTATVRKGDFDVSGPIKGRVSQGITIAAAHGSDGTDAFAASFFGTNALNNN